MMIAKNCEDVSKIYHNTILLETSDLRERIIITTILSYWNYALFKNQWITSTNGEY